MAHPAMTIKNTVDKEVVAGEYGKAKSCVVIVGHGISSEKKKKREQLNKSHSLSVYTKSLNLD